MSSSGELSGSNLYCLCYLVFKIANICISISVSGAAECVGRAYEVRRFHEFSHFCTFFFNATEARILCWSKIHLTNKVR